MEMDILLRIGIIAGVLQLIGYTLYLSDKNIDPNPVTWFMFAYGTAILTVLEWDSAATLPELILPMTCSVLGIVVSARCWWRARQKDPSRWWPEDWWPEDFWERWSFISDIAITVAYVGIWVFATYALITFEDKAIAVWLFLFLSNLSTFPGFYPILHTTWKNPEREYWLPWAVWTIAYGLLGFLTYHTHGAFWHILMFYPLSNALMHGLVSLLAMRTVSHKPSP